MKNECIYQQRRQNIHFMIVQTRHMAHRLTSQQHATVGSYSDMPALFDLHFVPHVAFVVLVMRLHHISV